MLADWKEEVDWTPDESGSSWRRGLEWWPRAGELTSSLTSDSLRIRLPRVDIFPGPVNRAWESSRADRRAIRFSFWIEESHIQLAFCSY